MAALIFSETDQLCPNAGPQLLFQGAQASLENEGKPLKCFEKGLADLCLCSDSLPGGKGQAGLEGAGLGETMPAMQVKTVDDDLDPGQ